MAAWKQLLIALVVLVAAGFAWTRYFPGADALLAQWGMDWARAAVPAKDAAATGAVREQGGQRRAPTVVTAPVAAATINDRLSAIGTGRANASVSVKPYASGRITQILVEAGARVDKGQVLARQESETEEIAVDRARIALDDAVARSGRLKSLRSSNAATAVQVTDAELVETTARLALRDAELALERRAIVAPIAGFVGILPIEAGNYVTAETQVAVIDDRSAIIAEFWVPERYASAIALGEPVTATSVARPSETLNGRISAVDNRLDEQSRTLLVRARFANPDDTLRAGMSFKIEMRFSGDTYPSVNPLAIQWGTDGAFVWAVRNGAASRVPVRIVQRNTENVLVAGELRDGEPVVTEGVHLVREGADLLIAGAEPKPAGATGASVGKGS
ncbi:MAG: efflux RND transporter periplasmic adaptor subunit [Rhizobiaceae bacterium]|nr:efflux RND transporter periplasmic adaptor subunit [Rhizobiaceae bacterium]